MKLREVINNAKDFLIDKSIVLKSDNSIINKTEIIHPNIGSINRIFDLNTEILFLTDLNIPVFFTLSMEQVEKDLDYRVFYVSPPYLGLYKKTPMYVDAMYNYNQNRVLFQTENSLNGLIVIKDYIFTDDITCRDVNTGEILWQFDLAQFGQWKHSTQVIKDYVVDQFVGLYEGVLYVLLSNSKIIGLDVLTGALKGEINLGEYFALETRNWLTSSCKMYLDQEKGRILWLTSATLLQIDLSTLKAVLIKSFFTNDYHFIWRFSSVTYYDGLLYFTGQYGRESGYPDLVGTMHPDTGEILWQYKIEDAASLSESPQVNATHLYVRDVISNNLYIFEKE